MAVARLRPGVTLKRAQAEMNSIAARLQREYPGNKDWGVGLVSVRDETVGNLRPALLILMAAVGLVLLIVCVNLANLLLARSAARSRELAVRRALGANRRRLISQLLTESLLLSIVGAAVGLVVASLGTRGLIAIAPIDTPGIETAGFQLPVLVYTAGVAFLTAIIFGLLPALRISHFELSDALKESSRSSTQKANAGELRRILVSTEFAMAVVLVVSASLMIKTLLYMHHIELGFQPDHVLTMRVPLNDVKYKEQQQTEFYRSLLERLRAIPGIQYATVSHGIPFYGWSGQGFVTQENPHPAPADIPDANYLTIASHYFDVLRIPLIKGRAFTYGDTQNVMHVAIVNEALARKEWPGQNPLGKRIKIAWNEASWLTVVGVCGNVRTQGLEASFLPETYAPYTQHPWLKTPRQLLIRTNVNPSVVPSIRRVIGELDPEQPMADIRTLEAVTLQPLSLRRFLTDLLSLTLSIKRHSRGPRLSAETRRLEF